MQVVTQEVGTRMPTMTIENGEERAFGPTVTFFLRRFLHIEHNWNTVFVVVSNNSLVCVGGISFDYAVLFDRILCRLEVWKLNMWQVQRLSWRRVRSLKQSELLRGRFFQDYGVESSGLLVIYLIYIILYVVTLNWWSDSSFICQASPINCVMELRESPRCHFLCHPNCRALWASLGF